jgi:hypothetical protein
MERPDFLTADLGAQVRAACRLLDVPEALADAWRDLLHPDAEPPRAEPDVEAEAATAPEPAASRWAGTWTDPPRASSG